MTAGRDLTALVNAGDKLAEAAMLTSRSGALWEQLAAAVTWWRLAKSGAEQVSGKLGAVSDGTCPAAGPQAGDTAPDDERLAAVIQQREQQLREAWIERDRLRSEVAALHTWDGLLSLLDEHYPGDVVDGSSGDPGPRIVTLLREVAALRDAGNTLAEAAGDVIDGPIELNLEALFAASGAWRSVAGEARDVPAPADEPKSVDIVRAWARDWPPGPTKALDRLIAAASPAVDTAAPDPLRAAGDELAAAARAALEALNEAGDMDAYDELERVVQRWEATRGG